MVIDVPDVRVHCRNCVSVLQPERDELALGEIAAGSKPGRRELVLERSRVLGRERGASMLTRRQLLQRGAMGGAALVFARVSVAPPAVAATPSLSRFTEALPIPPLLDGTGGGKSFTIAARESMWQFHAKLPATRTWASWGASARSGSAASPGGRARSRGRRSSTATERTAGATFRR